MELAVRYAYYAWGEPTNWYAYGATGGATPCGRRVPTCRSRSRSTRNGAGTPPMQGDLMIFAPGWLGSYWDGSGHVAVVRDVGPGYVDVVEENATSSGTDRFPLSGSRVTANGYTPLIGWLRETEQTPVELSASNVAGTPQSVSDQQGDMDVIWRGADLAVARSCVSQPGWQTQPRDDHARRRSLEPRGRVTVPGTGRRVLGGQRRRPLAGPVAGRLLDGSGDVARPRRSSRPARLPSDRPRRRSARVPVSSRSSGRRRTTRCGRRPTTAPGRLPLPLNSGVVTGNPRRGRRHGGSIAVVWRDPSGNLWSDIGVPYGWLGAKVLGSAASPAIRRRWSPDRRWSMPSGARPLARCGPPRSRRAEARPRQRSTPR